MAPKVHYNNAKIVEIESYSAASAINGAYTSVLWIVDVLTFVIFFECIEICWKD